MYYYSFNINFKNTIFDFRVNHSKNAINKTPKKTDAPDVQATMRRVREAQLRIANRLNTDGTTPDNESPSASVQQDIEMRDATSSTKEAISARSRSRSIRRSRTRSLTISRSRVRRRRTSRSRFRGKYLITIIIHLFSG